MPHHMRLARKRMQNNFRGAIRKPASVIKYVDAPLASLTPSRRRNKCPRRHTRLHRRAFSRVSFVYPHISSCPGGVTRARCAHASVSLPTLTMGAVIVPSPSPDVRAMKRYYHQTSSSSSRPSNDAAGTATSLSIESFPQSMSHSSLANIIPLLWLSYASWEL